MQDSNNFIRVGDAALYQGDCLAVMAALPDHSTDLVLADLPYGVTDNRWDRCLSLEALWAHYKRLLRPGGAIVLMAQQPFTTDLINSNRRWFRYCWTWDKRRVTGFLNARKQPLRCTEDIVVFYERQCIYNPQFTVDQPYRRAPGAPTSNYRTAKRTETVSDGRRYPTNLLAMSQVRGGLHPTQKPVELMSYLIRTYTRAGDVVLDNTMGSGTTGVAALAEGRRFVGIEQDAAYFQVAWQRIEAARAAARDEAA